MSTIKTVNMLDPDNKAADCIHFVIDDITKPFIFNNIKTLGEEYTFSAWIKAETTLKIIINKNEFAIDNTWQSISLTLTADSTNLELYFTDIGSYYLYKPQFEKGNHATDWSPSPEDMATAQDLLENVEALNGTLEEQKTSILQTVEGLILEAGETYAKSSDYEGFKTTVEAQLKVLADEISLNFSTTTQSVSALNEDTQSKFEKLYKHIKFSGETAITIGSGDSAITLEIDNETGIIFKRNGVQFGHWDGENFYTGNIIIEVNERAQLGNFAFVPRSDGSLSFLKVGG